MYYKIIQNENIVDVGSVFLRWSTKWNQPFSCDVNNAQLVRSYKDKVYYDEWLKHPPSTFNDYELGKIVIIKKEEFDEIFELLKDQEIIKVPVEEYPVIIEEPAEEPIKEKQPKTISEMRRTIEEQEEQINLLTKCLLEISEKIY